MRRIALLLTPLLAVTLPGVAWAVAGKKPLTANAALSPAAAAQFHILAGELAAQRQQPRLAAAQLLMALDYTDDAGLAQRATLLAFAANDNALAQKAGLRWQKLDPDNLEPREILLRTALRLNRPADALAQAQAIVQGDAGGEDEGLRHVALLLSQERNFEPTAMQLIRDLQKLWPDRPGALYALGILAMRFAHYEEAEAAAQSALRLDENSQDARLLLLGAQVKRGQIQAADRTFDQLIADGQNPTDLRLGYVKLLVEAQQNDAARRQLEQLLADSPDNEEALMGLALLSLDARDLDTARDYLLRLTDSPAHASDAAFYLGGIAQLQRKYAEALSWYEKVSEGNKALDSLFRRAAMMARLDRLDEARDIFESLRQQAPMLGHRIDTEEAGMLIDAGKPADALAVLDRALKQSADDAELLYARSLVYDKLNRFERAENDLRRLIKANPDDARALNALGFLLTLHTQRFDEAQQLLARALKLTPEDAAVIDSYGWLQFRSGQAADARVTLEKAYGKLKDPEIAAHYGEVLWTLGEKTRAREVWDAARADDPDHPVLKETVQRLNP